MSKCIHCGFVLPDEGDCARCAAKLERPSPPPILRQELNLDRRKSREVPAFTELELLPEELETLAAPAVIVTSAPVAPAPERASDAPRPAPLWRRMVAFAIDALAVALILGVYLVLAALIAGSAGPQPKLTGLDALLARLHALQPLVLPGLLLSALVALSYCAAFAFLQGGHTLGRRWMGIRLVTRRGAPPTPGQALTRAAIACASVLFGLAGFWLALFDRDGQALHDKLTQTFVVVQL